MSARRCNTHGNWPDDHSKYGKCPDCGEKTDQITNAEPMEGSELNHRLFEAYWKEWEAGRVEREMAAFEAAVEAAPSIPDPS